MVYAGLSAGWDRIQEVGYLDVDFGGNTQVVLRKSLNVNKYLVKVVLIFVVKTIS